MTDTPNTGAEVEQWLQGQQASTRQVLVPETLEHQNGSTSTHFAEVETAQSVAYDSDGYYEFANSAACFNAKTATSSSNTPAGAASVASPCVMPTPNYGAGQPNAYRVNSCEEYAAEKYYGFTLLKEAVVAGGHQAREIMDLLYDTAATGACIYTNSGTLGCASDDDYCHQGQCYPKTSFVLRNTQGLAEVASLKGATATAMSFDTCAFSNAFFAYTYHNGATTIPEGSCTPESWSWHQSMSNALAPGFIDEQLEYLVQKGRDFALLAGAQSAPADTTTILAALEVADNELDCLNWSGVTGCDWAPSVLSTRIYAHFDGLQAKAVRDCISATGDDFSDLGGSFLDTQGQVLRAAAGAYVEDGSRPTRQLGYDYAQSTDAFDDYLMDRAAHSLWLDQQLLAEAQQQLIGVLDPADGKVQASSSQPERCSTAGDDTFGNKFCRRFSAGWDTSGRPNNPCPDPGVKAFAENKIYLFGEEMEIFYANFEATASSLVGANTPAAELRILGEDVFDPQFSLGSAGPVAFNLSAQDDVWSLAANVGWSENLFSTQLMVGPVPVVVSGGVAFTTGLAVSLESDMQGTYNAAEDRCEELVDFEAQVTPFLSLGGFATAAAGTTWAAIGLKVHLTFINLSLPLSFKGYVQESAGTYKIRCSSRLDFMMEFLSGYFAIVAYLDLGFWDFEVEWQLFDWEGFKKTYEDLLDTPLCEAADVNGAGISLDAIQNKLK